MNTLEQRLQEMLAEEGEPSQACLVAVGERLRELGEDELHGEVRPTSPRTGRTRRRLAWVGFAVIVIAAIVAPIPALVHLGPSHQSRQKPGATQEFSITIDGGETVEALAVQGSSLYLASDYGGSGPYSLSAYDVASDKLLGQVSLPAMPVALKIGPGGRVWVTMSPETVGGAGTWLLSANLRERSATDLAGDGDIAPTGPNTALLVNQDGLQVLRMPSPGQSGHASVRHVADSGIGPSDSVAPNFFAVLSRTVAVQATDGYGFHSHLVIAGQPHLTFGGGPQEQVGYVVAAGGAFWITTSRQGAQNGPLVRLDGELHVTTPVSIRTNPILARTEEIWSKDDIVWAATSVVGHHLVCFVDHGDVGSVVTVRVGGQPIALTATSQTVYVAYAVPFGPAQIIHVVGYPVPATCQ